MKNTILPLLTIVGISLLQPNLKAEPSSLSAYGFSIQFNKYCKDLGVSVSVRLDDSETVENETHKREAFFDGEDIALVLQTNKSTNSLDQVVLFANLTHRNFTSVNLFSIMAIEGRFFEEKEIKEYLSKLGFDDPDSVKANRNFSSDVAEYTKAYDDTYGYSLTIDLKAKENKSVLTTPEAAPPES